MKKYSILAMSIVFCLAISAQDQMSMPTQGRQRSETRQNDRVQMTPQARAERLAKQLELTDNQKVELQAMYEKQDLERQKKPVGVKMTGEEMKTQFEVQRKTQDAELEKIIGTEKFQKLQAARAERMKQRGENGSRQQQRPMEIK